LVGFLIGEETRYRYRAKKGLGEGKMTLVRQLLLCLIARDHKLHNDLLSWG